MKLTLIISVVASIVNAQGTRYPFRYPLFHLKAYGTDPYSDERVGVIHDWT